MPSDPTRTELFDLYKFAIDEYRFEVRLNWDRSMYYITFNTGIVAVGAGLLKLGSDGIVNLFIAGIFLLGCSSSIMGILALRKGQAYYLRAIHKKTLIEDILGLTATIPHYAGDANLSIGTTIGQTCRTSILHQTDQFLATGLRRGSIVFYVASFLGLLSGVNVAGVAIAIVLYIGHRQQYIPWP